MWSFSRKQLNEVKQEKKRVCIKAENNEESCLFVTREKKRVCIKAENNEESCLFVTTNKLRNRLSYKDLAKRVGP